MVKDKKQQRNHSKYFNQVVAEVTKYDGVAPRANRTPKQKGTFKPWQQCKVA